MSEESTARSTPSSPVVWLLMFVAAAVVYLVGTRDSSGFSRTLPPGDAAPEVFGFDANGAPVSLEDYRGAVVVVDFWGFWCPHCVEELPALKRVTERFAGQPVTVLGINTDRMPDDELADKLDDAGVNWPQICIKSEQRFPQEWGVDGYPSVFIVDRKGDIRARDIRGEKAISRVVESLLNEGR